MPAPVPVQPRVIDGVVAQDCFYDALCQVGAARGLSFKSHEDLPDDMRHDLSLADWGVHMLRDLAAAFASFVLTAPQHALHQVAVDLFTKEVVPQFADIVVGDDQDRHTAIIQAWQVTARSTGVHLSFSPLSPAIIIVTPPFLHFPHSTFCIRACPWNRTVPGSCCDNIQGA